MNESFPLISIIVPVYNSEKYLNQCLDSIVNQTYTNLEIIIVDDGSSDNSPQLCDDWAGRDSRITVLHKTNGGAAAARNAGIDIAKGEYIGFVDSDDYISKDMFYVMYNALHKTKVKISCCKSFVIKDDSSDVSKHTTANEYNSVVYGVEETMDEIFSFRMGTAFWRRLFHSTIFDEIRFPEGDINEEYPLLIPIAVESGGTVFVDRALYYYRDRTDSVTGTMHKSLKTMRCIRNNLMFMKNQLFDYKLNNHKSFRLFVSKNSFFMLLSILKNHKTFDDDLKDIYESYICLAKENKSAFLCSKDISIKDKVLFCLIITGIYKKIYC